MELEEMQTVWSQISDQLENQKKLTNKVIMEMTQERFRNRIRIVSKYESIGAAICFIAAIILVFKLPKLDTWYLLSCGIVLIAYLVFLPIYVLRSISKMKNINLIDNNYKQTLIDYTRNRKQFLFAQKLSIYLNFVLLLVSMPVVVKLMDGKDIFLTNVHFLYWYLPIMVLFLIFFSRWGYGCYKNITASAENLLKDLEDPSK